MKMRQYLELLKGSDGVVRVLLSPFKGRHYLDIRIHFDVHDNGEPIPTKRGVSFNVRDVPRLRAAIVEAEHDAITEGLIDAQDYEAAGLPVPSRLSKRSAG